MKLLLDTHALLWFIGNDPQLSAPARQSIENSANDKFISAASLWEIAIKLSLGKVKLPQSFDEVFPQQLIADEMTMVTRDPEFSKYPTKVSW